MTMINLGLFNRSKPDEDLKIDYRFTEKLNYSDYKLRNDSRIKNGYIDNWEDDRFLLEMGINKLPSELGLTTYETATVFDPSLKLGNEIKDSMIINTGLNLYTANPPRVYEDGTIKLQQKSLSSSTVSRTGMCAVKKNYGWIDSMHIHNLKTDRGFQYKYVETIQLDGIDLDIPLVEHGYDAYKQNYSIIHNLIKSRLNNYDYENDKHIRGEVSDIEYNDGLLTYTVESENGSSIILDTISDIVKSGLLRLVERNFKYKENGWKITVEFEIFPEK